MGALALLRYPGDPLRRVLLAPFAATVVWALAGNLLVRLGLPMAQATPLIMLASLVLAALGVRSVARLRGQAGVATTLVAGLGLVVGLVAWPLFARGLTGHLGSPNPDTHSYTAIAADYWRLGLRSPSAAMLDSEPLEDGRNHTFV